MSEDRRQTEPGLYRVSLYGEYVSGKMRFERTYDETAYRRWTATAYRQLRDWLPASREAHCLDAGCGHGNLLYLLKTYGYENVDGVDRSEEQLALARQITERVTLVDVLDYLPTVKDSYEAIFAFDLLEHFNKSEVLEFLEAARAALVQGGSLIIQTPNADSPFGLGERYNDFSHEVGLNPSSISHLLRINGFAEIECRECGPVVHGFKSGIRWTAWRVLRALLQTWNLIETGSAGAGILTRVFRVKAIRT